MTDYSQGKIYMIKSKNTDDVYIGSTKDSLEERFHFHMMNYHKWLRTKKNYCTSYKIIKQGETYIELLENYPCETRKELELKEGEYQRMMDCVNKRIEGRTAKEYYEDNKKQIIEQRKEYQSRPEVKEQIKEYMKEYYQNNKERRKEYNTNPEVKEHKKKYDKEYNSRPEVKEKKKEQMKEYMKEYYKNRPKIKCVCGSEYRKADTKRHQRTQKHIKYIQEMKEKADATNLNEFFEQFKFKLETK